MTVEQLVSRVLTLMSQGHGQKEIVVCSELPRGTEKHTRVLITNVTVDPDDGVVEVEAVTEIR